MSRSLSPLLNFVVVGICLIGAVGVIYWAIQLSGPQPDDFALPQVLTTSEKKKNSPIQKTSNSKELKTIVDARRFQSPLVIKQKTKPTQPKVTVTKPNVTILDLYYSKTAKLAVIDLGNGKTQSVREGDKIPSINAQVKTIRADAIEIQTNDQKIYTYKVPSSKSADRQ